MRAALVESQGAPFAMQEEEEALENIPGSLRGPRIRKQNISFTGSTSSTSLTSSSPSTSGIGSYFVSKNTAGSQPSLEGIGWNQEVHEQTDIAAADFWFFNNLSMNVADSPLLVEFGERNFNIKQRVQATFSQGFEWKVSILLFSNCK